MRKSAGILLYRLVDKTPQFFLVHPGGPFWKGKDAGAWSIPKGEFAENEDPLAAARREFLEETGTAVEGNFIALNPVQQKGGKQVYAWAVEGDIDADRIQSNSFRLEWPYKSGKWNDYPEVDKAGWFIGEEAKQKINPAQAAFLDEVLQLLA
jgi:predicted NUDIX family NTP pyrophosphohydrolase